MTPVTGGISRLHQPMRNLGPGNGQRRTSHEQPEMPARNRQLADVAAGRVDETLDGKDLRRDHDLVVAGRHEEERMGQLRQVDGPAERHEAAGRKLVLPEQPFDHLDVIGARQVEGPPIPIVKPLRERLKSGRSDRVGRLQHLLNRLRPGQVGPPEPKRVAAQHAAAAEADQLVEDVRWRVLRSA